MLIRTIGTHLSTVHVFQIKLLLEIYPNVPFVLDFLERNTKYYSRNQFKSYCNNGLHGGHPTRNLQGFFPMKISKIYQIASSLLS